MEIRLCPRCARAYLAPATRCSDCELALEVHDEAHLLGSLLGNYRLERVLGSGGMGVVFAARHQTLLREAAIKVLQPELDARSGSGEFGQRFLREARLLATLEHPNIVGIYDFDVSPLGFPYLVMPRLRGETLRRLLDRHPYGLPAGWIAAIAGDVAAGLAHAHRHGVVHRDLKPENVFLALEVDAVRAKLLDFGIAHAGADDDLMRTATGTLMGTPLYQAPEQLRGEAVSAATDQYSFALLFAELLRGTPVRQGLSLTDILLRDSMKPLPADALPAGIDARAGAALARATAPLPADRHADIGALLAALDLPAAERVTLQPAIDDGSSTTPLTVVVAPPQERRSSPAAAPTTPPPVRATPAVVPTPPHSAVGQAPADAAIRAAPARGRRLLPLLGLILLALGAVTGWRWLAGGAPASTDTRAWLREARVQALPPGLLAPLADPRGSLLLRSAGGWNLFDPDSGAAGAGAALGVAEQLLGVDDLGQLWLAHDGTIEALSLGDNRRRSIVTGAALLADADAQTRWALAASGRWLARLDADGRFRVFRIHDGKVEEWITQTGAANDATRFALGDRYAVIVRPNAGLEVFALDARASAWRAAFAPFRVRAVALAEELDRLAVAGDGEFLAAWRLTDGATLAAPRPARELRALLWLRDGARLLGADSEALTLWRWREGNPEVEQRLPGGADWLYRGARALYAGGERRLARYDFGTLAAHSYAAGIGDTWAIAAGADAVYAGGAAGGDLVRVDRRAATPLRRTVHNAGITDLQLLQDRLVSSSDDRTIAVWRLPELELEWRAKGHAFLVNQIAIGESLWSSSSDGSLRRWRWPELEAVETLNLRSRLDGELELHALRVFGAGDAEILAGSWNHRLLRLRRADGDWQIASAPFEAQTGYRLVVLPALDAVLAIGLNPGRLALIERASGRLELLPREPQEWHAAAADADGHSVWLGGDARLGRLSFSRRDDGRYTVESRVQESSSYGEIGSLALLPATPQDGAAVAFGDEQGRLQIVPLADFAQDGAVTFTTTPGPTLAPL